MPSWRRRRHTWRVPPSAPKSSNQRFSFGWLSLDHLGPYDEVDLRRRGHLCGHGLPVSQLSRPVTALGIQNVQNGGCSPLVGVSADITRLRRLFQVAAFEKSHDRLASLQPVIRVYDVSQNRYSS